MYAKFTTSSQQLVGKANNKDAVNMGVCDCGFRDSYTHVCNSIQFNLKSLALMYVIECMHGSVHILFPNTISSIDIVCQ